MREIAARGQQGFCFRTACGQHDMFPDTNGIAGKPESLSFRRHETSGRSDPFGKSLLPIVIESGREIQEFTAAQGTQASVEVIESLVNQFEWNDLSVKPVAERREHIGYPIVDDSHRTKCREIPRGPRPPRRSGQDPA